MVWSPKKLRRPPFISPDYHRLSGRARNAGEAGAHVVRILPGARTCARRGLGSDELFSPGSRRCPQDRTCDSQVRTPAPPPPLRSGGPAPPEARSHPPAATRLVGGPYPGRRPATKRIGADQSLGTARTFTRPPRSSSATASSSDSGVPPPSEPPLVVSKPELPRRVSDPPRRLRSGRLGGRPRSREYRRRRSQRVQRQRRAERRSGDRLLLGRRRSRQATWLRTVT